MPRPLWPREPNAYDPEHDSDSEYDELFPDHRPNRYYDPCNTAPENYPYVRNYFDLTTFEKKFLQDRIDLYEKELLIGRAYLQTPEEVPTRPNTPEPQTRRNYDFRAEDPIWDSVTLPKHLVKTRNQIIRLKKLRSTVPRFLLIFCLRHQFRKGIHEHRFSY